MNICADIANCRISEKIGELVKKPERTRLTCVFVLSYCTDVGSNVEMQMLKCLCFETMEELYVYGNVS